MHSSSQDWLELWNSPVIFSLRLTYLQLGAIAAIVQDTTCPHVTGNVTMFRMMRGASSSPERRDMVISTAIVGSPEEDSIGLGVTSTPQLRASWLSDEVC